MGSWLWPGRLHHSSKNLDAPAPQYRGQFGYYTDCHTGLCYCIHRYYDPQSGRWISRDPAGLEGGVNVYEYCNGDPVMMVDPAGLDAYALYAVAPRLHAGALEAFQARAFYFAGKASAASFSTGVEFIQKLKSMNNITHLRVESHGMRGGTMADDDSRVYTAAWMVASMPFGRSWVKVEGILGWLAPAMTAQASPFIKTADVLAKNCGKNAVIELMGCNNNVIAQEISAQLGWLGRRDITVTGADAECFEKGGFAVLDSRMLLGKRMRDSHGRLVRGGVSDLFGTARLSEQHED